MPLNMKIRNYTSVDKIIRKAFRANPRMREEFMNWAIHIVDPYVPADTLALARSAHVESGGTLVYDRLYARKLYFGEKEHTAGISLKASYRLTKETDNENLLHFSKKVHPKAQCFWFYGASMDHMKEFEAKMSEMLLRQVR